MSSAAVLIGALMVKMEDTVATTGDLEYFQHSQDMIECARSIFCCNGKFLLNIFPYKVYHFNYVENTGMLICVIL